MTTSAVDSEVIAKARKLEAMAAQGSGAAEGERANAQRMLLELCHKSGLKVRVRLEEQSPTAHVYSQDCYAFCEVGDLCYFEDVPRWATQFYTVLKNDEVPWEVKAYAPSDHKGDGPFPIEVMIFSRLSPQYANTNQKSALKGRHLYIRVQ